MRTLKKNIFLGITASLLFVYSLITTAFIGIAYAAGCPGSSRIFWTFFLITLGLMIPLGWFMHVPGNGSIADKIVQTVQRRARYYFQNHPIE